MVVACHVLPSLAARGGVVFTASLAGAAGVDMFFVISGFIMVLVCQREPDALTFLRHRLIRIAPLYWLCTLLRIGGRLTLSGLDAGPPLTIGQVATSVAFLPYWDGSGSIAPLLRQGWSLQFEMFFYLVVAAALRCAPRRVLICASAALLGLVGVGALAGIPQDGPASVLSVYVHPMLLEFIAGLAIGRLWLAKRLPGPRQAILLAALGFAGLAAAAAAGPQWEPLRVWVWGAPCALIVLGCVALEAAGRIPNLPRLTAIGDASYSLYLTHSTVIFALASLKPALPAGSPGSLLLGGTLMGACVVVAQLVYRRVEAPLLAALRGRTNRPEEPSAASIGARPLQA